MKERLGSGNPCPKDHFLILHLKEVWKYKDLIVLFIKRDFAAQYKQTILGPVWHLLQPIFTTAIFLLLFGKIANIPTDGIKPVLFYMSGITMWNYFSACLTSTSNTFLMNAPIFGKVYFPRLVIPLSIVFFKYYSFGNSIWIVAGCYDLVSFSWISNGDLELPGFGYLF